ncbi:MAG: hypothetical protein ACI358_04615 [Candidatus Limimorpha sp.]
MKNAEKIITVLNSLKINDVISCDLIERAKCGNVWFYDGNIAEGVRKLREIMSRDNLEKWLYRLGDKEACPKRIAVVVENAAPFDGFVDMVLVLLSGNKFVGKGFENDLLLRSLADAIIKADCVLPDYISFVEHHVGKTDAIILDGIYSSNKALSEYLSRVPHLIHGERLGTRCLTGGESLEELESVAKDCFLNFGRGGTAVRNLFVPEGYDFQPLLRAFEKWGDVRNNPRYFNNYEYRKSACIVGKTPCIDNGFVILRKSDDLRPHVGEIYYHEYSDLSEVCINEEVINAADETISFLCSIQSVDNQL